MPITVGWFLDSIWKDMLIDDLVNVFSEVSKFRVTFGLFVKDVIPKWGQVKAAGKHNTQAIHISIVSRMSQY